MLNPALHLPDTDSAKSKAASDPVTHRRAHRWPHAGTPTWVRASWRLTAALVGIVTSPPLLADTTLEFATEAGPAFVQISDDAVRMNAGSDERGQWLLYRQTEDALLIVTDADRSYTRLDRDGIERLGELVAQNKQRAIAQLESQMDRLADDQRVQAETVLKQLRAQPAAGELRPQPTGETRTAGNTSQNGQDAPYSCDVYTLGAGAQKQWLCVSSPETLGLSPTEYSTIQAMYALLGALTDAVGAASGTGVPRGDLLPGIPVIVQDTYDAATNGAVRQGDEPVTSQSLTAVSHAPIPADVYSVPADYAERDAAGL